MTKEEAIKQLKIELSKWESDCKSYHKTKDALDMGIKALQDKSYELWKESYEVERQRSIRLEEKIKALEKESCGDAVSRSDVIALIKNTNYKHLFYVTRGISQKAFEDLLNGTQALPHVKPVACIAAVKFNKEDMQKIVDEKVKEIKVMAGDIVTCKDCKYNTKNGKYTAVCDMGHRFRMREPSTFYCADAERREQ